MSRTAGLIAAAVSTLLLATLSATGGAAAQGCRNSGDFASWLNDFAREAVASGVSERAVRAGLSGVAYQPSVVKRDRAQGVFSQSFLEFSGRMVAQYRLDGGRQRIQKHAKLFADVEARYGTPAPVITAFWGLETDFGANTGDFPTLSSLATLAYDCRRPEKFRPQLLDALRLIDRGDLNAQDMKGAWAGELGQLQFLPSDYARDAVDFDGDGRRNLIGSTPDAIASAAALLVHHGWRRGEPWLEEVVVPADLPWDQADLDIRHPRSQWAAWGVRRRDGALPADGFPAALVLPMGRLGPAFLAYPNFDVYLKWNQSLVYTLTAAYFATRLAGAPKVGPGRGQPPVMSLAEIKDLQTRLARAGYDVGRIDGIIGANTRAAIKSVQIKNGLPADSYPTPELSHLVR
jgi:lytic murein transglycosylase